MLSGMTKCLCGIIKVWHCKFDELCARVKFLHLPPPPPEKYRENMTKQAKNMLAMSKSMIK